MNNYSYAIVYKKKDLEIALENKVDKIIIKDPDLARSVLTINTASKSAITAAIAGLGLAATNFWNPLGWASGFLGAVAGGSIIYCIIALGLSAALIYAIHNEYSIKAKGKVTMPDGTIIEGDVILEKR